MNSEEAQAKITRTLRANGFKMTGDIWELETCGRVTETRNAERAVIVEMNLPEGLKLTLDRFRKNPLVLFEHRYPQLSIGHSQWEHLRVEQDRDSYTLMAKVRFHLGTDPSRKLWDRVFAGELLHVAPGVIPTAILETGGCARVLTADLIEYSIMEAPTHVAVQHENCTDKFFVECDKLLCEKDSRIADLRSLIAEIQGALKNTTTRIERRLKELDL